MSFTSRFCSSDFCRTVNATSFPSGETWGSSIRRVPSSSSGVKGRPASAAGGRHSVIAIRKRMVPAPVAQGSEAAKAERPAAPSAGKSVDAGTRLRLVEANRLERRLGKPCGGRLLVVLEVENVFDAFPRIELQADRHVARAGIRLEAIGIRRVH